MEEETLRSKEETQDGEWVLFWAFLRQRVRKPGTRPTAIGYLLLPVIFFGTLSTWIAVGRFEGRRADVEGLVLSIATYVITIAVTGVSDLFLERGIDGSHKFLLFFGAAAIAIFDGVITYKLMWAAEDPGDMLWLRTGVCVFPAWIVWWLVDGSDPRFVRDTDPQAAAGGNPLRDL